MHILFIIYWFIAGPWLYWTLSSTFKHDHHIQFITIDIYFARRYFQMSFKWDLHCPLSKTFEVFLGELSSKVPHAWVRMRNISNLLIRKFLLLASTFPSEDLQNIHSYNGDSLWWFYSKSPKKNVIRWKHSRICLYVSHRTHRCRCCCFKKNFSCYW